MAVKLLGVVIVGWTVLAGALALNLCSRLVGLEGWYELFQGEPISVVSWCWMIILYPAALGGAALLGVRLAGMIK